MRKVHHPSLIDLHQVFETDNSIYLVIGLMTGGPLLHKIRNNGLFSEQDTAYIIKQILQGVEYLHSLGIMHRDIKLENILFQFVYMQATRNL